MSQFQWTNLILGCYHTYDPCCLAQLCIKFNCTYPPPPTSRNGRPNLFTSSTHRPWPRTVKLKQPKRSPVHKYKQELEKIDININGFSKCSVSGQKSRQRFDSHLRPVNKYFKNISSEGTMQK